MSELPPVDRPAADPLIGYRSNEEWQTLLAQFAALAQSIEDNENEETKTNVMALLQATDAIHREALQRLVRLFKDGVLEQVITDPAIHTLMGMYDLLPEAAPACAKVWDFIVPASPDISAASVTAAQRAEEQPRWMPVPSGVSPAEGAASVVPFDDRLVVVAHIDGQRFAATAECPAHGVAMTGGRLSGYSWICAAGPGCVYDIRNGSRLGGGRGLECHPVRVSEAGEVRVGLGMPFQTNLPAF